MHKVLVADAQEQWRELLEKTLGQTFQVCTCADGLRALELTERYRPDVLVLDLMLSGTDGLSVVRALQEWPDCPRIIVTGRYFSNFVTMALERCQVDSIMLKPCTAQSVAERVLELLSDGEEVATVYQDPYDYITTLLVRLGARTSQQGFRYLRRGILLLLEEPGQQLTKQLYPAIAAEFKTSANNVEKALRTTVTNAWVNRRDEIWRAYFPVAPGGQIPKPTAGQFLIRMSDAVRCAVRRQA